MAEERALDSVEKKELESTEEQTVPGKFYVPYTDIYETEEALTTVVHRFTYDASLRTLIRSVVKKQAQ